MAAEAAVKTTRLAGLGRALAHRNYRLFFAGQAISMTGTWMTRIATGWLVFSISDPATAALLLGIVGFVGQVPAFFLTPLAGVLVDRWDRHRLLILTQALALVQSALLAAVAFGAAPGLWTITLIIGLSLFQGFINAFDMPTRQAFLVDMVSNRDDLPNAIALNSSLVNGTRLLGPCIGGMLIAGVGTAWCFVVDAFSYVAVLAALQAMRINLQKPRQQPAPVWHGLIEGFRYAFGFAPIRSLLLLLALISFMGMPYIVLLPIFAANILHGGPYAFGFLTGASGLGALIGALYLASRTTVLGLGRIIVLGSALFGTGLICFGLSCYLWLSLLCMLFTGFGMMVQMASSNTILQTIVDEDKRGRVMSFYTMSFLGVVPFGSLFAGLLAGRIGANYTVMLGGSLCLLGTLVFALRLPQLRILVRPIYESKGILPAVARGLQTATELNRPPER